MNWCKSNTLIFFILKATVEINYLYIIFCQLKTRSQVALKSIVYQEWRRVPELWCRRCGWLLLKLLRLQVISSWKVYGWRNAAAMRLCLVKGLWVKERGRERGNEWVKEWGNDWVKEWGNEWVKEWVKEGLS